jgi:hypothetical protein
MSPIIIAFIASLAFAGFSSYIADEKNRSAISWFFLGLFFNIIALIAITGLPKAQANQAPNPQIIDTNHPWVCPKCKSLNDAGKYFCRGCDLKLS